MLLDIELSFKEYRVLTVHIERRVSASLRIDARENIIVPNNTFLPHREHSTYAYVHFEVK